MEHDIILDLLMGNLPLTDLYGRSYLRIISPTQRSDKQAHSADLADKEHEHISYRSDSVL